MRSAKRYLAFLFALCLLFLPSCRRFQRTPAAEDASLVITFLDVGQGDAILMQTPDGAILVDAGTERSEEDLILRLKALGISSLSLFVMTHPDADHIGGADGVIKAFEIDEVWCAGTNSDSGAAGRMNAALDAAGLIATVVTRGKTYALGGLEILVLSPATTASNTNASSLVLLASFGETDLLLMGDADEKVEASILESYPEERLDCEILKAGHHGSKTASSLAFLEVATPAYTIISCGAGNSYGYPHGEVLERLETVGSEVLRTDRLGSITIKTDGNIISVGK